MNFLNKMERKFGRYAIHNLTKYMILCYIIGYALQYMQELFEVPLISYLYMSLITSFVEGRFGDWCPGF